jgi:hypothetical protein
VLRSAARSETAARPMAAASRPRNVPRIRIAARSTAARTGAVGSLSVRRNAVRRRSAVGLKAAAIRNLARLGTRNAASRAVARTQPAVNDYHPFSSKLYIVHSHWPPG